VINIVIITADSIRHNYFKIMLANNENINVLKTYVESNEQFILETKNYDDNLNSVTDIHYGSRLNSEFDFFSDAINICKDKTNSIFIKHSEINERSKINEIIDLNPELIVTYGCSIIQKQLIEYFKDRIINIHLGLSPYYFGAGTNFHALVNNDFQCVGYTFMYMDEGIDTGEIIHQARASIEPFDNPHQIGNRLIKNMTKDFIKLINNFDKLEEQVQPINTSGKKYKVIDATEELIEVLYNNFQNNNVIEYLNHKSKKIIDYPIITQNFMECSD
jgi:phosphoribosylglycinamide formyltransferase-1